MKGARCLSSGPCQCENISLAELNLQIVTFYQLSSKIKCSNLYFFLLLSHIDLMRKKGKVNLYLIELWVDGFSIP